MLYWGPSQCSFYCILKSHRTSYNQSSASGYLFYRTVRRNLPVMAAIRTLTCCILVTMLIAGCAQRADDGNAASRSEELRILTYNVWYGFTRVPERKDDLVRWIENQQPDIVSLQELNGYTEAQLAEDASRWGHEHSVLLKEEGFPTGLTSRFPIEDVEIYLEGFHHGLMRARTAGLYIYVVHLHPSNWQTRIRETELMLDDLARLPADADIVLAGDFNTFSPKDSAHYSTHTSLTTFFAARDTQFGEGNLRDGNLDYTPVSMIEAAGFVDLEAHFRTSFAGTFPTQIEKEGEHGDWRRLDYLFANPSLAERCRTAFSLSNATTARLSDHYPVIATFSDGVAH